MSDRHQRRAQYSLVASVVCFASTISFSALAVERLGIQSNGWKEYLAFGPVQTVRYAVSVAIGISIILVSRRSGPTFVLPARAQLGRLFYRLVLPQVFASGLLYVAFAYGDPAIAGATLFSSAFLSLAHARATGEIRKLTRVQTAAVSVLLMAYVGGMLVFLLGGGEVAASVTSDEIAKAITLSFLAAIALAVYVSSVGINLTTAEGSLLGTRDKAIAVSIGVLLCSLVVAALWSVLPGTTNPSNWTRAWASISTLWPILLLGVATYWANELLILAARRRNPDDLLEREPTTRTIRTAALTCEPLVVIGIALVFPPFRRQIPLNWHARWLEIAGCSLMALGAMGAAAVAGSAKSVA